MPITIKNPAMIMNGGGGNESKYKHTVFVELWPWSSIESNFSGAFSFSIVTTSATAITTYAELYNMLKGKAVLVNGNGKVYSTNVLENILGVYVDNAGQNMTVYTCRMKSDANNAARMFDFVAALSSLSGDIVHDYVEEVTD